MNRYGVTTITRRTWKDLLLAPAEGELGSRALAGYHPSKCHTPPGPGDGASIEVSGIPANEWQVASGKRLGRPKAFANVIMFPRTLEFGILTSTATDICSCTLNAFLWVWNRQRRNSSFLRLKKASNSPQMMQLTGACLPQPQHAGFC